MRVNSRRKNNQMSLQRALIAGLALAAVAWVAFILISVKGIGDALPELTSPSQQSVSTISAPDRSEPAAVSTTAPIEPEEPEPEAMAETEEVLAEIAPPPEWIYNEPTDTLDEWRGSYDPLTLEELQTADGLTINCRNNWPSWGMFLNETERDLGGFDVIDGMSESELQELADSGANGYTQAYLAQGLLEQLKGETEADEARMENALHYSVQAILNGNWFAASLLAGHYYDHDRIEARAWMEIAQSAGAPSLLFRNDRESIGSVPDPFNDYEVEESEKRAAELIAEYEMETGLGPPEECLGRFKRD